MMKIDDKEKSENTKNDYVDEKGYKFAELVYVF